MVTEHFWRWSWIAHPDEPRLITDHRTYHGITFKFYKPTPADTEQNKKQQLVQIAYDLGKKGIYSNQTSPIAKEYYIHEMYQDNSLKLKPGYFTDTGKEIPHSDTPPGMGPVYGVSYYKTQKYDLPRHISTHKSRRYL